MEDNLPIPGHPAEITPAWLNAALREGMPGTRASVAEVTWEIVGEDRGFTGVVARLALRYDEDAEGIAGPQTLIAKLPLAERGVQSTYRAAQGRDLAALRGYHARCAREVRFYREIAPHGGVAIPRCYYASADEATLRIAILLEDLAAARGGDVLAGCSPEEAALVLDPLARFHARWWTMAKAATFAWLPRWGGDHRERQARYARQVAPFLARYGHQLPDEVAEAVEWLKTLYGTVLAALDAAPTTIIHADLHLDNVLFVPSGSGTTARILDWQSVCTGPAAIDFANFSVGSLDAEQRRTDKGDLCHRYHVGLMAHGVRDYPLDAFRHDCRLALLRQLAGTVGWLGSVNLDELQGRERLLVEAALGDGRLIAALRDHDAIGLLRDIEAGR